jgi:hypothetical protein
MTTKVLTEVPVSRPKAKQRSTGLLSQNLDQAVSALVHLGYPISRYANEHPLPERTWRIFNRARQAYYQNRAEFNVLSALLHQELRQMAPQTLVQMAQQAIPFVPMWQGPVQGQDHIRNLQQLFC